MHIFGKFCRINLICSDKKQFSRATKGLSQDGDEIWPFLKNVPTNCFVTFALCGGCSPPCPPLNTALNDNAHLVIAFIFFRNHYPLVYMTFII
jgi:hypothetical protein